MPDLTSWAIPLYRAFGILVKLHPLFFVVTLGMFLRQVGDSTNFVWWGDIFLLTVVMLFGVILLHEYGHCFGGRSVGGEATEILIWPLGGLAYVELPNQPRAHFITVLAGPMVNFVFVVCCSIVILLAGYFPSFNPLKDPYTSELRSLDGKLFTSGYGLRLYKTGTAEEATLPVELISKLNKQHFHELDEGLSKYPDIQRARLPLWLVWVNRLMWLNLMLLLFNLIPAYPLDGGQLLHAFLWERLDYRRASLIAGYSGMAFALLFMTISIYSNSTLLMGLAIFMLVSSAAKLQALEMEDGMYGDFSQGFSSLEREEPPPPRPNFIKRWMQARAARRIQRELEERQQDEERMDQLLDKIAKFGKDSLTSEEQRFMERVSARYRNR
jgi:Zn-dependent protease